PMRMWRTMFSISTIALSTRTPVLSVIAGKLTTLSEKPNTSIAQKCREDGKRERNCGDHGCPQISQEQEHHEHGQDGAFEQRVDGGVVVAGREGDRCINQLRVGARIGGLELVDAPRSGRRPATMCRPFGPL